MRLSLIQITVGPIIEKNFEKVDKFINQALSFKPNLILLPECFLFLSNINKFSLSMDHEYILHYQNFAKNNEVNLLLGSLPILDKDKIFNRSILINHQGAITSYYDKIHMFDVILKSNEEYKESDTYTPGSSDQTVMILESMKMEIEVKAGSDGKVSSIDVAKGQNVEEGQGVFTLV